MPVIKSSTAACMIVYCIVEYCQVTGGGGGGGGLCQTMQEDTKFIIDFKMWNEIRALFEAQPHECQHYS